MGYAVTAQLNFVFLFFLFVTSLKGKPIVAKKLISLKSSKLPNTEQHYTTPCTQLPATFDNTAQDHCGYHSKYM